MTRLKFFLITFNWLLTGCHKADPLIDSSLLGSNVLMAVVLNITWIPYSVTVILKHLTRGKIQWLGQGTDESSCFFPSLPFSQAVWLVRKRILLRISAKILMLLQWQ